LLGKGLGTTPEESRKILSNAVEKGLIKSFTIEERVSKKSGAVKTGSSTVTLNDGTVVNMNRLGSGHRVSISQDEESKRRSDEAAKRAANPSQAKNVKILKDIAKEAARTKSGKLSPTDFGKQISPTTGFRFPCQWFRWTI